MSALVTDFPGRKPNGVSPINVVEPYEPTQCDVDNDMAPRTDDSAAIREATHGAMLAIAAMAKTIESQATQPKSRLNGLMSPLLTVGAVVVTVFGVSFIPTSTSNFREDLRMANYKIEQSEKREGELRDRQQSQEYIWNNLQKSLSALGIEVDGKTGQVTAVRGRQVR